MRTLILRRSEVMQLLDIHAAVPLLRMAFQSYSLNRPVDPKRVRSDLPASGEAMLLFPGLNDTIPAYTVKVHVKYPEQQPAIQGVLHLHDLATGSLLVVMDSTYLTAVRTGISGALAADILARSDAAKVAIIGAGVQGRFLLRAFAMMRTIEHVWVFDTNATNAENYAQDMSAELHIPMTVCQSVEETVSSVDAIFTATWSRVPFLSLSMVQQGCHITTLGPDEPGKCEVGADLIQEGLFVCDDRSFAVSMGAVGGVGLTTDVIAAELGEVIAGHHPGRTTATQITIYGGVGLAFQDLIVAWLVYQAAQSQAVGQFIDFLA